MHVSLCLTQRQLVEAGAVTLTLDGFHANANGQYVGQAPRSNGNGSEATSS